MRNYASARVVRGVDDDQFRSIGDLRLQVVDVCRKPGFFVQRQRDRGAAGEVDHRLIDREARVRVDHLIALFDQGEHGEEHDRLAAGRYDDVVRVDVVALAPGYELRHSLAGFRQTRRRPVVRKPVVDRLFAGRADVIGRIEVRLADLEVDDAPALCLQRLCLRQRLERRFGAEDAHT